MSIELNQSNDDHFDDDEFIQETLNFSMNQNSSISEFKIPSPVSELINNEITTTATTTIVTLPKCRLDFNVSDTETPRNSLNVVRNRKRTNFSRRCLSTDLNSGDHYEVCLLISMMMSLFMIIIFFHRQIKCLFRNFVSPTKLQMILKVH